MCFLVRDKKVLLARILYPEGVEIWNGISGWVEEGETPEEGIIREVQEEIGVKVKEKDLRRGYESESNGIPLTAFTLTRWEGKPSCREESLKELKWFEFDEVPYEKMIEGNKEWLPPLLTRINLV